jgi:stress response protein YsnF
MTTAPLPVILGVFRDRRLAEQAIDALKQSNWVIDDPQMIEKNTHGIFGAFKNARTAHVAEGEPLPDELAQVDLPEEERQLYQYELGNGSFLVLVHPQGHLLEIRDILKRYGGYHIFIPFQVGGEQVISLRQEVPQVQKQIVDVGEIRIHKHVITEERTFTIPVTREEVTIERFPRASVSAPSPQLQPTFGMHTPTQTASPAPSSAEEMLKEEGILRILVHEEQVIIQKQVVVVEEIIVQKQAVEDVRHLVEPIKHEEVRIESIGNAPVHEMSAQEESSLANKLV